jgi:recombination protein RecA|nr:MAG TPA: Protein recA [Caudoviricetes sp.]
MARKKAEVVVEDKTKVTDVERRKRIELVMANLRKKNDGIVVGKLTDPEVQEQIHIEFIPTPSINFNSATGGGIPKGNICILAGVEDSGKTSLVLETIGKMHRENPEGHFALWLESEASLNLDYMVNQFGIDPERFFFIQFDRNHSAEQCLDQAEALLQTGVIDLFCINTLKALIPESEMNKSMEQVNVGAAARMNSRMMGKFVPLIKQYKTAMVLVQHLTTNIGGFSMYGDNLILAGGRAIRTASMLTVEMRKASVLDTDPIGKEDGIKINCKITKNHCIPREFPYRKFTYYAIFGEGIEQILSTLDELIDMGVIHKAGAWMQQLDPETGEIIDKWNGRNAFREDMKANPDKLEKLKSLVHGSFETLSEEEVVEIKEQEKLAEEAEEATNG